MASMTRNRLGPVVAWLVGPVPTSVVLALLIGAGFIVIAGADPIAGYSSMLTGSIGSGPGVANTVQRAIPLIGMALAVSVAFRAGVINLGGEGQFLLGGLTAGIVALKLPGPGFLVAILAIMAGVAAGALWGALSAVLQLWPGVPVLITALLLNYPARYFSSWMVRFQLKDVDSSMVATPPIDPSRQIPMLIPTDSPLGQFLGATFGPQSALVHVGRTVNWSLVLLIILVVAIAFMNRRTVFGLESGINGLNPQFAKYGGVRSGKLTVQTMLLSGGIAGFMGSLLTIGAPNQRIIDGALVSTNYAWTGLLVALLALYRVWGVVAAGLFFAAITAGSGAMGRDLSMSPQIAAVIQGIVIVLIGFKVTFPKLGSRAKPPAAEPKETAAAASQEAA